MSDNVRLPSLSTFPRLLMHHAQVRPNHPATREKDMGIWQTWTWLQVAEEVRAMASGLAELGDTGRAEVGVRAGGGRGRACCVGAGGDTI